MGPPRTRLTVEERREQLLAFGVAWFSAHAFDAASIDEVARRAGVSKGLLYHYFGSKRGFYVATVAEVCRRLVEATAPPEGVPFAAALDASLGAFVAFVRDNPALYRALLRGGVGFDAEVLPLLDEVRAVSARRVLERLGVAAPSSALRVALHGWVGFTETACLAWLDLGAAPDALDEPAMVALLTDALHAALAAAGAPAPPEGSR